MERNNLVQPHESLKGIWHLFFGIGFWTPRNPKRSWWDFYDRYMISFVQEPADPIYKKLKLPQ